MSAIIAFPALDEWAATDTNESRVCLCSGKEES